MTTDAHDSPPPTSVHALADLQAWWDWLAGPWGYGVPQVFAIMIDADGTIVPNVVNVRDDDPTPPEPQLAGAFVATLAASVEHLDGTGIAVMWARPGRSTLTAHDRTWLRALHAACETVAVPTWPVFFSTDDGTGPVPADLLVA